MAMLTCDPHPLLEIGVFVTRLDGPMTGSPQIDALLAPAAVGPMTSSDAVRTAVRDLLRAGGFKPAGRSKPASEYLVSAHAEARFPRINPLVDACNAVSLHSGLPISLIDLELAVPPLRVGVAPAGTTYVFNPSGQVIDASQLLCVFDAEGPTGTPVKDAQRTKTHDGTRTALSVVWGTTALAGRTREATRWYRELVATIAGATVSDY
jgi:DNA/RNA-binding domain of Phe-tRNA-synthetase-like protein